MKVSVAFLPGELRPLGDGVVVVFDVLRATTSMAAALAAGVAEIRLFPGVDCARAAAADFAGKKLLCGEVGCLPPPGFDLGNSPGAFGPEHAGCTAFMATTNGTPALIAAQAARSVLAGALVNAAAVAQRLYQLELDATLLCAGTGGELAMEDVLGCGAVLEELQLRPAVQLQGDGARMALRLFRGARGDLQGALSETQGGQNVIRAGLPGDIEFAARLNALGVVCRVAADPLRVVLA